VLIYVWVVYRLSGKSNNIWLGLRALFDHGCWPEYWGYINYPRRGSLRNRNDWLSLRPMSVRIRINGSQSKICRLQSGGGGSRGVASRSADIFTLHFIQACDVAYAAEIFILHFIQALLALVFEKRWLREATNIDGILPWAGVRMQFTVKVMSKRTPHYHVKIMSRWGGGESLLRLKQLTPKRQFNGRKWLALIAQWTRGEWIMRANQYLFDS